MRHFLGYLKSCFSNFFYITTKTILLISSSFLVQLFCKLSSSGSSDPYHFGGTRSVLSWETIVHCPRYKLRGQIRLKDRTLSLGSDLLLNHLFALQVFASFMFFLFLFFF